MTLNTHHRKNCWAKINQPCIVSFNHIRPFRAFYLNFKCTSSYACVLLLVLLTSLKRSNRAHNALYRFPFAVKKHSIWQSSNRFPDLHQDRNFAFPRQSGRLVYRLDKLTLDKIDLKNRKMMFQCFQESFNYTMQSLHAYLDTRM